MAKIEPKGKGLKAFRGIKNIINQVMGKEGINEKLKKASENLGKILKNSGNIVKNEFILTKLVSSDDTKQKSMVEGMPERIEFELIGLRFYIDFTIEVSKQDELYDARGSIIYGTNRSLYLTECLAPDGTQCKDWSTCYRKRRCDKLEDKPLIKLSMDRDGMILSQDKFEGELWLFNDLNSLLDLHYRILDHILEGAIYWANENLLA